MHIWILARNFVYISKVELLYAYYNCILEGYKAVGLDTSHPENALARSIEFGEQNHQLDFFDRRFDI